MNNCKLMKLFSGFLFIVILASCGEKEDEVLQTINGNATYYGEFFHGKKTKSGELFNMNDMTAAHASFSMGTTVRVTNLENNKSVIVTINDEPRTNRKTLIDLSKAAFKKISELDSGKIKVKMEVLEWGGGPSPTPSPKEGE